MTGIKVEPSIDERMARADMYGARDAKQLSVFEKHYWPQKAAIPNRYIKNADGVMYQTTYHLEREVTAGRLTLCTEEEVEQYLAAIKQGKQFRASGPNTVGNAEVEAFEREVMSQDLANAVAKSKKTK